MQRNILWTGIAYHSMENCIVSITDQGMQVRSSVIGTDDNIIYKVDYKIESNNLWETTFLEVRSQLNNSTQIISFRSDGKGSWSTDGKPVEKFTGCIDIDISLTPFTNTLAIKRLKLPEQEAKQIKVLYVDILNDQVKPVYQQYKRLSNTQYKFENVPNDFESIISVDELGLVVTYPELFTRLLIKESSY